MESTAFEMEKSRENVEQSWSVLKTSVMKVLREGKKRIKARKRGKINGRQKKRKLEYS